MCATILALIFLVASCGGDSSAPSFEIPGSGGNAGGGNSGNGGNKDDSQDNDNPTNNPKDDENKDYNYESIRAFLEKNISNYTTLSGEISNSKSITLTAQTIDTILDIYPDLEKAVKNKANEQTAENSFNKKATTNDIKKALIAQAENKLTVTKGTSSHTIGDFTPFDYTISAQGITIKLSGDFDFNKYYFIKNSSTTVDLSDANFYTNFSITVNELSEFHSSFKKLSSSTLPKLTNANLENSFPYEDGVKKLFDILDDYSFSNDKLSGLIINWNNYVLNGKSWSNNDYLFTGNTENTSTKMKLDIEKLIKFTSKTGVNNIKNIRITGSLSKSETVSWKALTNVIFEGDMSKLNINLSNNTSNLNLTGVVYFKSLPYTHSKESLVEGAVKLDTFPSGFKLNKNSVNNFVLDLTNVNSYTGSPIGGSINAVYFKDNPDNKGTETLFEKIVSKETGVIFNVYYGNSRSSDSYNKNKATGNNEYYESSASKRSLKDFEDYGNNRKYPDGTTRA